MPTERHTMAVIRYQVMSITLSSYFNSVLITFLQTQNAYLFGKSTRTQTACKGLDLIHLTYHDIIYRYQFLAIVMDDSITGFLIKRQYRPISEVLSEASLVVEE